MNPRAGARSRRRALFAPAVAFSFALALLSPATASRAQSVLTYHAEQSRSGNFIVLGLDPARARTVHLDRSFRPRFTGNLYAQPLYWRPRGARKGVVILATESDRVYAIDAATGANLWSRSLGRAVPLSSLPCGNIDPLGITGTPVIDPANAAIYLDAATKDASGMHHRVFALSLKDGAILPGWPVDIAAALGQAGIRFNARFQNQRGALAILGNRVFIPFGGHYGDCGSYHGWVVGIREDDPADIVSWRTRAKGGGVWAPGGLSSDARSLFFATGNTIGAREWGDGEAVFRLTPSLSRPQSRKDYFVPADWRTLDARDLDLGGTTPLPLDLPAANGPEPLLLALGKDGRAYLLDRHDLGGVGASLVAARSAGGPIITAPAVYPAAGGAVVAFPGKGTGCPMPQPGDALIALKIRAGSPPRLATQWCAPFAGKSAPIVTTTDGRANPIVWILGAEGDNRLHAYRGDSGAPLFRDLRPKEPMAGLHHLQTLLVAGGRLVVGADSRLYAFSFGRSRSPATRH
jgi:PQQ enzyme repeat